MRTKARRCFYTESERTAYYLSEYMRKPWYVCESEERQDLVLSDENLKRYMKLGYTVGYAFFRDKRYKNVYMLDGKIQFVM